MPQLQLRIGSSLPVASALALLVACKPSAGPEEMGDDPPPAGATDRTITVTSQCAGQTVVVGVNGGFVQSCGADGSCPQGTTCLAGRNACFWEFPAPSQGSAILNEGDSITYVLDAPPIEQTITTGPARGQTIDVKWSGNLYASTQCRSDGSGCQTAMCNVSSGGVSSVEPCANGVGPQGPVTLAEFTLSPTGVDFYDISVINGVNIPIAMAPTDGASDPSNPYTCMTAGGTAAASTGLLGCSWSFEAGEQGPLLQAVAPGGAACSSNADCTSPQVCGGALDFATTTIATSCGAPIGWWTADELCTFTGNAMGAPISCNAAVSGQGSNVDLYQCTGANAASCYNQGAATDECCGCPSWTVGGTALPLAPGFQCYADNPSWDTIAEPFAAFLKQACPTAYSFPFDDATSTFTCSTPSPGASSPNTMGYEITLCPGGQDGQ
jgi:Thaumatin family